MKIFIDAIQIGLRGLDLPDPPDSRTDFVESRVEPETGILGHLDDCESGPVATPGPRYRARVQGEYPAILLLEGLVRMAEKDELGAYGLGGEDDPPKVLSHSLEVSVEEEDGAIGAPDEAPGPEIGVRISVAAHALHAWKDESRVPRSPLDIFHAVAKMGNEIDLGREAPEDGRQRRDVMVGIRHGEYAHDLQYSPRDSLDGIR